LPEFLFSPLWPPDVILSESIEGKMFNKGDVIDLYVIYLVLNSTVFVSLPPYNGMQVMTVNTNDAVSDFFIVEVPFLLGKDLTDD